MEKSKIEESMPEGSTSKLKCLEDYADILWTGISTYDISSGVNVNHSD